MKKKEYGFELNQLIKELEKGDKSKIIKNFDPVLHLKELHRKYLNKPN